MSGGLFDEFSEGVLEDEREQGSLSTRKAVQGKRRESSLRGRVGDQQAAVVLKRNVRTTAYHLDRRESPWKGDRWARSVTGGLEGDVREGRKKGKDRAGPSQGG
jgi:hypothetical protein